VLSDDEVDELAARIDDQDDGRQLLRDCAALSETCARRAARIGGVPRSRSVWLEVIRIGAGKAYWPGRIDLPGMSVRSTRSIA
jgi:hypothetical protein